MPLLKNEKKQVRDIVYYYHRFELYAIRKGPWKAHFITKPSYRKDVPATVHETPILVNIEIFSASSAFEKAAGETDSNNSRLNNEYCIMRQEELFFLFLKFI